MPFKELKDQEIIDFYWHLHLSGKSLSSKNRSLGTCYEFSLIKEDYVTFPELEGAENLILFEENGKVRCMLERY
jgi:hypothetical protein